MESKLNLKLDTRFQFEFLFTEELKLTSTFEMMLILRTFEQVKDDC
jgi:hypothetical protein